MATQASYIPEFNAKCVQLVLDINAELIQVCVEFQNRGWFQDPDFAVYQARLQSNLLYLATVADHFTSGQSLSAAPELKATSKTASPATHPQLTKALNSEQHLLTPPDLNDLPAPKTPAAQRLQTKLNDAVTHFKQREQMALDAMTAHSQKSYNQLRQAPVGRAEGAALGARSTTATPPRKSSKTTANTTPTTDSGSPSGNASVDPQALLQMQRELDPHYTSNSLIGNATSGSSSSSIQAAAHYTPIPPFHTNNLQPSPIKPPQLQAQELKRQQMLQRMTPHTANQSSLAGSSVAMPNAMDVSATSPDLTTPGSFAMSSKPATPAPLPGAPGTSAPSSSLASPARTSAASAMPPALLQANTSSPANQMSMNSGAPMPSMATGTMNMAGMPQQLTPQQQQQLLLRHQQQQRLMASMGMAMNMNPQYMMNPQMVMHQMRMQQLQQMNATMMANAAPNAGNMFAQSSLVGNRGMVGNNTGAGGLNPQMAMSLALANQQSMLAMSGGGTPNGHTRNTSATGGMGGMHSPNPMANLTMGTQSPRPPTMVATPGSAASGTPGSMGAVTSTAAATMAMPFSPGSLLMTSMAGAAGNHSAPSANNNSSNNNFQATAAGLMGGVGAGNVGMMYPNEMMLAAMNMSRGLQPNSLAGGATNVNQFGNMQTPNSVTSTSLTPAMLNSMMAAGQNLMLNPNFHSPNPNNSNNNGNGGS